LVDALDGDLVLTNDYHLGIGDVPLRETSCAVVDGGGPEACLLVVRGPPEDPLYVVDEPHVQHPVRLV
jgi:hypothetical protein